MTNIFEANCKNLPDLLEEFLPKKLEGPLHHQGKFGITYLISADGKQRVDFSYEVLADSTPKDLHDHLTSNNLTKNWEKAFEKNAPFCIAIDSDEIKTTDI